MINDGLQMVRLLEARSGFAQWRFTLPDMITLSPAAATALGWPGERQLATIRDLVLAHVPEDRSAVVDLFTGAIETRMGFQTQTRVIGADGGERRVEILAEVVVEGERVTEVYGALRDITFAVRQQVMAQSRARLIRELIREIPMPVAVLDERRYVTDCNGTWAAILGLAQPRAVIGRALADIAPGLAAELSRPIGDGLQGMIAQWEIGYYSPVAKPRAKLKCVVVPWLGSEERPAGVIIVIAQGDFVAAPQAAFLKGKAKTPPPTNLIQTLKAFSAA